MENVETKPEIEVGADTVDESKLDVIGELSDGTPVVTRESMAEQFGEEAIKEAEDTAKLADEVDASINALILEDEAAEEIAPAPGKVVVSKDAHYDANGRYIEEEHYEDGTGMTVAIDGVKVN